MQGSSTFSALRLDKMEMIVAMAHSGLSLGATISNESWLWRYGELLLTAGVCTDVERPKERLRLYHLLEEPETQAAAGMIRCRVLTCAWRSVPS